MNQGRIICSHIKFLSKEALQKLTSNELNQTCNAHTASPLYYLCLHCGHSLCLQLQAQQSCLQFHSVKNKHFFYMEIQQGSIWCQLCKDTIQNQLFDYNINDKSQSVLKLRRFEEHIINIWNIISQQNNIKTNHFAHRGIKNLGNTCYLNAVLQLLYSSEHLKQLYSKVQVKEDKIFIGGKIVLKEIQYFYDDMIGKKQSEKWTIVKNKKQKVKQQSKKVLMKPIKSPKFNIVFKRFLQQMNCKEKGTFIPQDILNALSEFNSKYRSKQQQDAEELLLLIIDVLNEGERISFLKDLERYKEIESILGFQKLTPIQSLFSFYLINQVQCNQCKQTSTSINLSSSIGLAMEEGRQQSDCIEHKVRKVNIDYWQELFYPQNQQVAQFIAPFFKTERLNKFNNYYQCNKCKSVLAFRKYYMVSEPQILIINIKRFNSKLQKKNAFIQFPLQLRLQGASLDKLHFKYKLFAIIVHEGTSITNGHYFSITFIQNQWVMSSDERVQVVSEKFVKRQQPYILLYSREQGKQE